MITMVLLVVLASFFVAVMASMTSSNNPSIHLSSFHLLDTEFSLKGQAHQTTMHRLIFVIKQRNTEQLDDLLLKVSDPLSEKYGHYLSRAEVAGLTSNPESTQFVIKYLQNLGLSSVKSTNYGEYVTATAPLSLWEEVLETVFFRVAQVNGDDTKTAVRCLQYTMPNTLHKHVLTILNTVQTPDFKNRQSYKPLLQAKESISVETLTALKNSAKDDDVVTTVGTGDYQLPKGSHGQDSSKVQPKVPLRVGITYPALLDYVYNIDPSLTGSELTSQAIFSSDDQVLAIGDLQLFDEVFRLPHNIPELVYGGHVEEGYCHGVLNCAEANLDTEYLTAIGTGVPTTYWYNEDSDDCSTFMNWIVDVSDSTSPPHVVTISYGMPEHYLSAHEVFVFDVEIRKLGIQGVTVLAASGDSGVSGDDDKPLCGYNPDFPASSPYVTSVGATQGPEWGMKEVACSGLNCGYTSGGGFSNIYPTPSWQRTQTDRYFSLLSSNGRLPFVNASYKGTSYPYGKYNSKGRGYPDVSLLGVKYLTAINGSFYPLDGTSASCPVFAGMVSLVNSQRVEHGQPTLGYLNPALYLYASSGMIPTSATSSNSNNTPSKSGNNHNRKLLLKMQSAKGATSFNRDIATGENHCMKGFPMQCCNFGFSAVPGWDPVTGLGSIDFAAFFSLFMTIKINANDDGDVPSAPGTNQHTFAIPSDGTSSLFVSLNVAAGWIMWSLFALLVVVAAAMGIRAVIQAKEEGGDDYCVFLSLRSPQWMEVGGEGTTSSSSSSSSYPTMMMMVEGDTTTTGRRLGHVQERQDSSTQFTRLSVEMPDYGSLTNINIETQPQPQPLPRSSKHRTTSYQSPESLPTSSAVTSLPSVYLNYFK